VVGQNVTYTSHRDGDGSGVGDEDGTVNFQDGGVTISRLRSASSGGRRYRYLRSELCGAGDSHHQRVYSGDAISTPAPRQNLIQTVNIGNTTTAVTSWPTSVSGQNVTTRTVTATAPASGRGPEPSTSRMAASHRRAAGRNRRGQRQGHVRRQLLGPGVTPLQRSTAATPNFNQAPRRL